MNKALQQDSTVLINWTPSLSATLCHHKGTHADHGWTEQTSAIQKEEKMFYVKGIQLARLAWLRNTESHQKSHQVHYSPHFRTFSANLQKIKLILSESSWTNHLAWKPGETELVRGALVPSLTVVCHQHNFYSLNPSRDRCASVLYDSEHAFLVE